MSESALFFYHTKEVSGGWIGAPAEARAEIREQKQPKYETVLDLDTLVDEDEQMTKEEWLSIKYRGPFYADWDCADLMEGAGAVNRFLDLLRDEHGVDLACVRLYATGGRGYHVEIPFEVFTSSKDKLALYLPYIYKEIANILYTDDMDMAIYSAKRGRMWRTPNVKRENGKFKVPITIQQMRAMTPESYADLCSCPQPMPVTRPGTLSTTLAAQYAKLKKSVDAQMKERKKRLDNKFAKNLGGEWPESVVTLMNGENLSREVGLNKIALQLGILSAALGKDLDAHLTACKGLMETYRGDGHPTSLAVRKELIRMYRYAEDNICYGYEPAAMAAIMASSSGVDDLRGVAAPAEGRDGSDYGDLTAGMMMGTNGLYHSHPERGPARECSWHPGRETVTELVDANTESSMGYMMASQIAGQVRGEVMVDPGIFVSADKTKMFIAKQGGIAPRLDTPKAGGIMAVLMNQARMNNRVYTLPKEGFNLIESKTGEPDRLVWVAPLGCYTKDDDRSYRFRTPTGSEGGFFQSDVMAAPKLSEHPNAVAVVDAMLNFNLSDYSVAATLGWLVACWHKPYFLKYQSMFPLLQLYGESGAGKTSLAIALIHMFYYREKPKMVNAAVGTAYGRRMMFTASSTVPVLVDEFKPHLMSLDLQREFRMTMHELYQPEFQSPRGGGDSRSATSSWSDVVFETKTTPMMFSTETAETETAIQERVMSAQFSKSNRVGRAEEAFTLLKANPHVLASVGKLLLQGTVHMDPDKVMALIKRSHEVAQESLNRSGNSRVVYNASVSISGITFFQMVLKHQMKEAYEARGWEERFTKLREALLDQANYPTLQTTPELVKILRMMITESAREELGAIHVQHDVDVADHGGHLDINVDSFYGKYRQIAQRTGETARFQNVESMYLALRNSSLAMETNPPDSPLNKTLSYIPRVVRLNGDVLIKDYQIAGFPAVKK